MEPRSVSGAESQAECLRYFSRIAHNAATDADGNENDCQHFFIGYGAQHFKWIN